MANCKELLVALAQGIDDPQIGIFNLYSEEDCGNSIEEQVKMFFGASGIRGLEPGQYMYSYEVEYAGDGWASEARILSDFDAKIYLYKIGNNE